MESHDEDFILDDDFFDASVVDTGFPETEIDSAALVRRFVATVPTAVSKLQLTFSPDLQQ